MRLGISEILDNVAQMPTKQDKIACLRSHYSPALAIILRYAFDPAITWRLPEGKPPYRPSDSVEGQGMLYTIAPKLWRFVNGVQAPSAADFLVNENLKSAKRELLFVGHLEAVDPADAKLLLAIKDKKIPQKGVTRKLVEEAFPGLIPA